MKTTWPKIAFLVLCVAALAFELWHFRSNSTRIARNPGPAAANHERDFTLLPADNLELWTRYFAPTSHAESWEPTLGDMNDAEGALLQITELSKNDPDAVRQIENPRDYYRQYLAVLITGKKMMFLNAGCAIDQNVNWRKRLVIVRDGGKCFWHAMYDPSTQKFSDLSVNGQA